jgi:uncharacterized membrane protein YqjE
MIQADFVALVIVIALATAGRIWNLTFSYRQAALRLRERRRLLAERDLFERLERCMQSDRVE